MGEDTADLTLGLTIEPATGEMFLTIERSQANPAFHEFIRLGVGCPEIGIAQFSELRTRAHATSDPVRWADGLRPDQRAIFDSWPQADQFAALHLFRAIGTVGI